MKIEMVANPVRRDNSTDAISQVDQLRQMIDFPGKLSANSSSSSINTNTYHLINDKIQNRILVRGDIVDKNHESRHLLFLEK